MSDGLGGAALQVVGIVGVLLFLGAYAGLQLGLLRGQSFLYAGINLFAALFVMASLIADFSLAAALNNGAWIVISLVGIIRLALINRRLRFSDEEARFLRAKLPFLDRKLARTYLDECRWVDAKPGDALTKEGETVADLVYFASGGADVSVRGASIGAVKANVLVGEFTVFDAAPATATVRISSPSRLCLIDCDAVRRLARENAEIERALQVAFMRDAREKLMSANARADAISAEQADGAPAQRQGA